MAIKTRIIRIGNSRGVRLPKALLEQSGLGEQVEIEAESGQITIRAVRLARAGWEERFQSMSEVGDDRLLDADTLPPTQWDETEWTW